MQVRFARTRWAILGAALAVLVGGMAYAAIPHSGTKVITACYAKTDGALRVIDAQAGKTCKDTEKKLTWSAAPGIVKIEDLAGKACTTQDGKGTVRVAKGSIGASEGGFYYRNLALQCRVAWPADGTACDDGRTLTTGDVFQDGECAGTPPSCDDADDGTDDSYDADADQCVHVDFDVDDDGFRSDEGDCNDNNALVNPDQPEVVGDGQDNNCDGTIDEGS